ncbi:MAG: oligosaccharide flippase family protein [Mobilitalea sp.]
MKSRIVSSIKNIYTGIILQIVTILLSIITRKIFVNHFGIEILGINGILTNVISMLNLVEMGIGIAISQSLYKPLAQKNHEQVNEIMHLFAHMYKIIALIVSALGIILFPFLHLIVKTNISMRYVYIAYLMLLMDTVLSYFLSYRRNILLADQKKYKINNVTLYGTIALNILQIIGTILTKSFLLFLFIKIVVNLIQNIYLYFYTNNKYKYLMDRPTTNLEKQTKLLIFNNIKALFVMNISTYLIFGTDNILLSIFAGTVAVGLYSNYSMVINSIKGLISQVFTGITASYGNFLFLDNLKEAHDVFLTLYFCNFWICTFCSVSLMVLLNPFIVIWIGNDYLLPLGVLVVLIWNFYADVMRSSTELVRAASGLYSPYRFFKYWIFVEAVANLVFSILLAGPLKLGIYGVFIGTMLSGFIATYVLPWNLYKYVFHKSSKIFYFKHIYYTLISIVITTVVYYLSNIVHIDNLYILFTTKILICLSVPNIIIVLIFHKTKEYQYIYLKIIKRLLKK